MRLESDWGVIQKLNIEADTYIALKGACMVASVEHKRATHFVEKIDEDGSSVLSLKWTDTHDAKLLPFELVGPDEMAEFIKLWLTKKAVYPNGRPDTDGSNAEGFMVSVSDFYDVITIKPTWITYGK